MQADINDEYVRWIMNSHAQRVVPVGTPSTVVTRCARTLLEAQHINFDTYREHAIIDGVRMPMKISKVNSNEIRGWWLFHNDQFCCTVLDDNTKWLSWTVKCGSIVWVDREFNIKDDCQMTCSYRILNVMEDDTFPMVRLEQCEVNRGVINNEIVDIPISKYLEEFNPLKNKMKLMVLRRDDGYAIKPSVPAFISIATLVKIKQKWRQLYLKTQEKKYRPDGIGAKRARDEFEQTSQITMTDTDDKCDSHPEPSKETGSSSYHHAPV
jgi:hypothetical protein